MGASRDRIATEDAEALQAVCTSWLFSGKTIELAGTYISVHRHPVLTPKQVLTIASHSESKRFYSEKDVGALIQRATEIQLEKSESSEREKLKALTEWLQQTVSQPEYIETHAQGSVELPVIRVVRA